jgi:hypothetical protein
METDAWKQIDTEDDRGKVTHIIPVDDLIDHDIDRACVCGPSTDRSRSGTPVFSHWPLDRRP